MHSSNSQGSSQHLAGQQSRHGQLHISDLIMLERLGEGTYGTVFKVRNKKNGELSALKQIKLQDLEDEAGIPSCAVREISFLSKLDHENVIKLKNIIPADGKLYLLFELMDQDLRQYINKHQEQGEKVEPATVQRYSAQILQDSYVCYFHPLV